MQQKQLIYWQKQGIDQLCGVHTINSLLQGIYFIKTVGPFYDEVQLANVALQLDKKQKQLMQQEGVTKDFLKYMAQDSGNVALDEVLKKLNLKMTSIKTSDKNQDLTAEEGFICNSSAHWFAIRKIKGIWYNLNSTHKRLPQIISQFYLSAFLHSVKQFGYQIFSVEGEYPQTDPQKFQFYNQHQKWYNKQRIEKYQIKKNKRKNYEPNIGGGIGDKQMEQAIAASLGKTYEKYISSGQDSDWNEVDGKKKQLKPFGGKAQIISDPIHFQYDKFNIHPDDVEMISFMKTSLVETFSKKPQKGIMVCLRENTGKKQRRMFQTNTTIQELYDYIWIQSDPRRKFYLVDTISKQKLIDLSFPIEAIAQQGEISVFINDI